MKIKVFNDKTLLQKSANIFIIIISVLLVEIILRFILAISGWKFIYAPEFENNLESINTVGTIFEAIGTTILGFAALWQSSRISILERELQLKQVQTDQISKSIDQSYFFVTEIIPKINQLDEYINTPRKEELLGEASIQQTQTGYAYTITKFIDKRIAYKIVKVNKNLFNILEAFSIIAISDIVDNETLKNSTSNAFCQTVERYMAFIFLHISPDNYVPILKLYIYWKYNDKSITNVSTTTQIDFSVRQAILNYRMGFLQCK